jgi:hypothetical protein
MTVPPAARQAPGAAQELPAPVLLPVHRLRRLLLDPDPREVAARRDPRRLLQPRGARVHALVDVPGEWDLPALPLRVRRQEVHRRRLRHARLQAAPAPRPAAAAALRVQADERDSRPAEHERDGGAPRPPRDSDPQELPSGNNR